MSENYSLVRRPMGCRNMHIAELKSDEGGTVTFGTPVKVDGIENFQYQMVYAVANGYSDDIQDTNMKLTTSCDVSGVLAQYLPAIATLLQGNNTALGGKIVKTTDQQKHYAVLYQVENSDGTDTYRIFYKTKLAVEGETNNTKGENVEFGKMQFNGKAIPLKSGVIYREFNSSENLKADVITNFYTKVLLPDEKIIQD